LGGLKNTPMTEICKKQYKRNNQKRYYLTKAQSRKGMKIGKSFRKRVISLRLGGYAPTRRKNPFSKGFVSVLARREGKKINLMSFFATFVSSR
jgi:hypothetical protein